MAFVSAADSGSLLIAFFQESMHYVSGGYDFSIQKLVD